MQESYAAAKKELNQDEAGGKLVFDSNFESGNLYWAEAVSLTEYNLFMNVDTNTRGHS